MAQHAPEAYASCLARTGAKTIAYKPESDLNIPRPRSSVAQLPQKRSHTQRVQVLMTYLSPAGPSKRVLWAEVSDSWVYGRSGVL